MRSYMYCPDVLNATGPSYSKAGGGCCPAYELIGIPYND
jgi:hypothetical protein